MRGFYKIYPKYALCCWFYNTFYNWRSNGNNSVKCRFGHCTSRYLLRGSTFPLCSFYGSSFCYICWFLLLNRKNYRRDLQRFCSKIAFLGNICWSKFNLFSYAFFGSCGHAKKNSGLSRCLCPVKLFIIYRCYDIFCWCIYICIYSL